MPTYDKTTWINDSEPAINAANLNKIEAGIKTAQDTANAVSGGFTFVGTYTPTGVAEYPPTANEGELYIVDGLLAPYTFIAGDLAGATVFNATNIVRTATEWIVNYNSFIDSQNSFYDGAASGLTAQWVQDALDEIIAQKASASGIATLDAGIQVPLSQLGNVYSPTEIDALLALKASIDSPTGIVFLPSGTTVERPILGAGDRGIRYNTDLNTFEGWDGTVWTGVGGGATGGGSDKVFVLNEQTVTTDYTIPVGQNAHSAGTILIDTGITVVISTGSEWVIS